MKAEESYADELFKKGVEHLHREEHLQALSTFEKSFKLKETVLCQSYLGLCVATERGNIKEGLTLCEEAVAMEPEDPVLYLNLGKVLFKAGRKHEGIETVRKGLGFGESKDSVLWLQSLGIRKNPVFPFLNRKNFLNKYLGLLLSRLGFR